MYTFIFGKIETKSKLIFQIVIMKINEVYLNKINFYNHKIQIFAISLFLLSINLATIYDEKSRTY